MNHGLAMDHYCNRLPINSHYTYLVLSFEIYHGTLIPMFGRRCEQLFLGALTVEMSAGKSNYTVQNLFKHI